MDNSIRGDDIFLDTNINGTHNILKCIRKYGGKLVHVSTDEVYGSLGHDDPGFTESTPYDPRNPYSASKAASDHLVRAYVNTHGLDAVVTNCSNNYGPRQHSEKFIPTVIRHIKNNTPIPVYGTGQNIRDWLFVEDHCEALLTIGQNFKSGERYNIGGGVEMSNLDMVTLILDLMGKPVHMYQNWINFVPDRKGHDFRYAMDATKIAYDLSWQAKTNINEGLIKTMKDQESVKLEFLMMVNDNIIVQRFFNVREFNEKAKNSVELYDLIREFKDDIQTQLSLKTVTYMTDNMYEIINNPAILETSYIDGPEYFNIFIKQNDVTICHRQVDAKIYPPKVRYTVDVRPHLKNLLMSLTDIFSDKNLTYDYLDVSLSV